MVLVRQLTIAGFRPILKYELSYPGSQSVKYALHVESNMMGTWIKNLDCSQLKFIQIFINHVSGPYLTTVQYFDQ